MSYAKGLVQAVTPVRTGNLRRGWETRHEGWDTFSFNNPVIYAPYVEKRLGMVSRSQQQIQRHLGNQLGQHIEQELN
ncbi:hypothetical protein [Pseudanabaena sp. FACHB-2040]|uniref:hypothetical protein n=1 Tax=Pseudanabaena sp. FACHB-2040 TaxID=2692859 RepID=UPI001F54A223|nr:hypothetical protein [Pseudanabaena sp. FACHB-2040]